MNISLRKLVDELSRMSKDMVGWDSEDAANCAITSIEVKECDPEKDQYADVLIIKAELTENSKQMKDDKQLAAKYVTMEIPLDVDKKPTTITVTKTMKVP